MNRLERILGAIYEITKFDTLDYRTESAEHLWEIVEQVHELSKRGIKNE